MGTYIVEHKIEHNSGTMMKMKEGVMLKMTCHSWFIETGY